MANKCKFDPKIYAGLPIGMFHCPECGEMVIAAMDHPDYSVLDDGAPNNQFQPTVLESAGQIEHTATGRRGKVVDHYTIEGIGEMYEISFDGEDDTECFLENELSAVL
jgi:hypothetical protein